jgi:catechol 2,3-dioxygenase-like lactoylglutathione lyase family enzyme
MARERSRNMGAMKPKISIVTLGVRDFAKSLAFYRDGLGFPTHNHKDGEEHVMFAMEGSWLSLYPRHLLADDATVPDDGKGFSGVTLAQNEPSPERVDAVFAQAIAAGGRAVKTPQDVFWGGYSGYFADPDGYLWEVAYNPFTDLT